MIKLLEVKKISPLYFVVLFVICQVVCLIAAVFVMSFNNNNRNIQQLQTFK